MKLQETFLKTIHRYDGKILNLRVDEVELPNGKTSTREVIEHHGGVTVAALTSDMELLFVRQFRYPYEEVILELPAGKLERGENPMDSGIRELREETGAVPAVVGDLGKFYPTCGYCTETIHMYYATGLQFGEQDLDENEFLEVERIPLEKAVSMILSGEIRDGKTTAAVLKLYLLLQNGTIQM